MRQVSILSSGFIAALLVFGGMWALNNTALGLSIKCQIFNDLGACVIVALSGPPASHGNSGVTLPIPRSTESPEAQAARVSAAAQERLDQAVRDASAMLGQAVEGLLSNADELEDAVTDMEATVDWVSSSVEEMKATYEALEEHTYVYPMDEFAQYDVCYALNDVEFARNEVDYAASDFEFTWQTYETALRDRRDAIADVEGAIADLTAAQAANPDGVQTGSSTAPSTVEDGEYALAQAEESAKAAAAHSAGANADVEAYLDAAHRLLSAAESLAATAAYC